MFAGILAFGDAETCMLNPSVAIGLWVANGALSSGFSTGLSFTAGPLLDLGALVVTPILGMLLAVAVYHSFSMFGDDSKLVAKLIAEGVGTLLITLTLTMATGSVGLVYVAATYAASATFRTTHSAYTRCTRGPLHSCALSH